MEQSRIIKRFKKISLLIFGSVAMHVYAQTPTLYDIIAASPNHNTLEAAIDAAGLKSNLQSAGGLTVFAPTDSAFSALPAGTVENLLKTPEGLLKDILLYHVLGGQVNASAIENGGIVTALSSLNTLKLTKTSSGKVYVNHAEVAVADLQASNGVLHVINKVLMPNKTVVDIALGSNAHTTLVQAVVKAHLLPALTDPTAKFTVFAPTNEAFATLLPQGLANLSANDLSSILLYHVLADSVAASVISNGMIAQSLNSANTLKLTKTEAKVFVNHAEVTTADLRSTNGIVHVINKVILPNKTVIDIALGSSSHTTLVKAVVKAQLLPALTDPTAKFTVFAPTNEAFSKINESTLQALLQDSTGSLKNVLLYHVVGDSVRSKSLKNNQVINTLLENQSISITLNNGVFVNTSSQVTVADLSASNGIVHVVDLVLLPNLTSLDESNEFSSLEIFPNPSSSVLHILAPSITNFNYSIVNTNGQTLINGFGAENKTNIDISTLNSGIYTLILQTSQGQKAVTLSKKQ